MKKGVCFLAISAMLLGSLAGCGVNTGEKSNKITVYTHMGQRVLGEEKKDEAGNTYRDESTAILAQLGEQFSKETGIEVEFKVVANESELEPLLKVEDPDVDVFTCPNWSIEQWQAYAEPYSTIDEAKELYGDYAAAMPNDEENIYSLMPGRAYNQGVVYNDEVLKSVGYDEVPEDLSEFEALCQKLRDKGIDPIAIHRVENWPLATVQDFAGYVAGNSNAFTEMIKSDTPFSEDEPMGKTIKMYTTWKSKGFFEKEIYADFGVAMDAVAYGKAGMMLFGSWVVPQIQGRVPEGLDPSSIKFATPPDFGKGRYILSAPADNYSIARGSDNKEGARKFIEYIADSAKYIADSGFIANKKGVEPIVPELYALIDTSVEKGETKVLLSAPTDDNTINNQEVLKDANLYSDYKYVGLLFDTLDVTKPDDWSVYEKQVETQNAAYAKYKKDRGIEWVE